MLGRQRRPLRRALLLGSTAVSVVLALFINGEPGWAYDPSQLDTMFQDIAGTTPVTGPGDPVGLNLDRRLWGGRTLAQVVAGQPEIVAGANLLVAGDGLSTRVYRQSPDPQEDIVLGSVTAGKLYRIRLVKVAAGAGSVSLRVNGSGSNAAPAISSTSGSALDRTLYFTALVSGTLTLQGDGDGTNQSFDLVSVKEIPGFHRGQSTSAARPTLARVPFGGRRNLLIRTEELDNAAWGKGNATVTANVVTFSDGTPADEIAENTASASHYVFGTGFSVTNGVTYVVQARVKAGTQRYISLRGEATAAAYPWITLDTQAGTINANAAVTASGVTALGGGEFLIWLSWVSGGTITNANFIIAHSNSATAPSTATATGNSYLGTSQTFYAAKLQVEAGTAPTAYQKVTSTHDVTETGKADCWYFSYDGTDDHFVSLRTLSEAQTDKGLVASAVRKNVDHTGVFVELTANFNAGGTANGRFMHLTDSGNIYSGGHKTGTGVDGYSVYTSAAQSAGHSGVVITTHDFAGASRATELPLFELNGADAKNTTNGTYADNNPTAFATDLVYWGRRGGSSSPFNGHEYASVARFAAIPSAGQIAALRTYMANKAGYAL